MRQMTLSVKELAEIAGARLVGDGSATISGVAPLGSAAAGDVVFVEAEARLPQALASAAGAVIAGEFASSVPGVKPLLISPHPRLSFARAAARLHPPRREAPGVHPSATIHPSATVAPGASIQAFAVVGEQATIGEGTQIGPGVVVGAGVRIGEHCDIKAHAVIYPGTAIGDRVIVHASAVLGSDGFGYVRDPATGAHVKFPQAGRLEIGDDVEIGAGTTIDRGALGATVIARGVKLDNLVHVAHNVRIGEDALIAAQTGIAGSSVVERDVVVAGQVGIADHVRIERGAIIGAQAGVPTGKVIRGPGVVFWGSPARPLREHLKQLAALARITKRGGRG
jgi:UDP-3-O-[3-hydroxymyristoyl] glucosamine N-acyltransferase